MRKIKYIIPIVLLFMVIGFATITTSLSIDADMELLGDLDNFAIYYSRAVVNGEEDSSIIVSSTELDFGAALKEVGTPYVIEYDITNASSSFDAEIEMTCSGSTEYFEISNVFDTSTPLEARQTRTGTLTLTKIKTLASDDINSTVSCTVVATPVERNSESSSTIPTPLVNPIYIGREIAIGDEKFNIISSDDDTVTMLAQYNVNGSTLVQSSTSSLYYFSDTNGWEYTPGPKEIEIQNYNGSAKNIVNDYVTYIKSLLSIDDISGDLVTLKQLQELGCVIQEDYSYTYSYDETCVGSSFADWLINGQGWWTRSPWTEDNVRVWLVGSNGVLMPDDYNMSRQGIRPTVTIPKNVVYSLIDGSFYLIGQEVCVDGEYFNVISQTDIAVSMLAQYNISGENKQSTSNYYVSFSDSNGWEYTPGPKEIDVQIWGGEVKTLLNNYVSYLQTELGAASISGNLITLTELKGLGCTINDDYSYESTLTCANSIYESWLVSDQFWWTRSASSAYADYVWSVYSGGHLYGECYDGSALVLGVRPVITISKSDLKNLDQTGTLISFSIMGTTYQALQGMTWAEWVDSEYNTSNNYIVSDDSITDSAGYPVTYEWVNVGVNEKIVANRDYENYS